MTNELVRLTACEAVRRLRKGEVTPLELIDAAAGRIEAVEHLKFVQCHMVQGPNEEREAAPTQTFSRSKFMEPEVDDGAGEGEQSNHNGGRPMHV